MFHKYCVMDSYFNEKVESLVTYYILPTIGMSYKAFGPYYKDCKINKDLTVIRLELSRGCKESFWENEFYQTDYDLDGSTFVIFRIPDEFLEDVAVFVSGKYSKMSQKMKKQIYKYSGLHYNKQIDNLIVTDMKLLTLSKHSVLREWLLDTHNLIAGKNSEFIKLKNKEIIYYD